jgi:Tfp pilus assembly protein PilO
MDTYLEFTSALTINYPHLTDRRKFMQRRKMIIILFPAILFIWMLGWSLCWIGDNHTRKQHATKKETWNIHVNTEMIKNEQTLRM